MENQNRTALDKLTDTFKEWLHIQDEKLIYTLAAIKYTHHLTGDPIWLMLIGPSSGGKSEILRAFHQEREISVDDLTKNTFVSGYKGEGEISQFAASLKDHIWYIYDLSILMSRNAEDRSSILSDMRMIYDGRIKKRYGNKQEFNIDTSNNTLICGTTPVIDNTMLEDQMLGTRFITYRLLPGNRQAIMDTIDKNQQRMELMRETLNLCVRTYEEELRPINYELTELDNQNISLMSNMTTLLRTSVSFDRTGEPSNLAYPEEPGRLYKQLKKLYEAMRIIGLSEEEALECLQKICKDNVNPIRVRLLQYIFDNNRLDNLGRGMEFSTSKLHTGTGIGKKTVKSHMHALNMLGLVSYDIEEDNFGRVVKDKWRLLPSNLFMLLRKQVKVGCGRSMWPIYGQTKKKG